MRCIEELRKIDPEMPIQRVSTFIYVVLHEGTNIKAISEALNVDKTTTNRNVRALGKFHRNRSPGHDLIYPKVDPKEPRRYMFKLTAKGKRLAQLISEIIEGKFTAKTKPKKKRG